MPTLARFPREGVLAGGSSASCELRRLREGVFSHAGAAAAGGAAVELALALGTLSRFGSEIGPTLLSRLSVRRAAVPGSAVKLVFCRRGVRTSEVAGTALLGRLPKDVRERLGAAATGAELLPPTLLRGHRETGAARMPASLPLRDCGVVGAGVTGKEMRRRGRFGFTAVVRGFSTVSRCHMPKWFQRAKIRSFALGSLSFGASTRPFTALCK